MYNRDATMYNRAYSHVFFDFLLQIIISINAVQLCGINWYR